MSIYHTEQIFQISSQWVRSNCDKFSTSVEWNWRKECFFWWILLLEIIYPPSGIHLAELCVLPHILRQTFKFVHRYICHICDILQLCTWQNIYMRFPGSQTCLVQFIFNELCCMEWNLARKCIFHFFLSFSLLHHIHICVTWLGKIYMSFSRSGIISDLVWELTAVPVNISQNITLWGVQIRKSKIYLVLLFENE